MRKIIQNNHHLEKGQVIPILVIGILVTVMMAALLIDGGMVLSHRRTAQAAADAGALAAVKSLCPGSGGTNADARAVAITFVEDNDAEFINLPDGEQFPEDHTIRVEARAASQAFFSGVFDQMGLTANAAAEANCRLAAGADGAVLTFPAPFPCLNKVVDENGDVVSCGNINAGDMAIFMDSDSTRVYCFHPENNPGGVSCPNPINYNSSRGWMSLDGGPQLKNCWLNASCPAPLIYPNTWLSRIPGNRTSEYKHLADNYINETFVIGIYDQESAKRPSPCPSGDTCILRNGNGHGAYRIVGFAEFTLTCVARQNQSCPFRSSIGVTGGNTVEGFFTTDFSLGAGGGGTFGQYIVQLTQ